MTPAPGAGSEGTKQRRRRRRPAHRAPQVEERNRSPEPGAVAKSGAKKTHPYEKRVDEISAGGLVIDISGSRGLLIGRIDQKDQSGRRILWSLPKGHIEEGETPQSAALREVLEETGIESEISRSLGIIDFWFMAGGKRIHKTVHHFLFKETGGLLTPQESEVDEAAWFSLGEIVERLAYPDEKKLIARSGDLLA